MTLNIYKFYKQNNVMKFSLIFFYPIMASIIIYKDDFISLVNKNPFFF